MYLPARYKLVSRFLHVLEEDNRSNHQGGLLILHQVSDDLVHHGEPNIQNKKDDNSI